MKRTLFAVKSCQQHMKGYHHEAILTTWARDLNHDLLFFVGGKPEGEYDDTTVVPLDCPDSYNDLPLKTKAILKYSLDFGYDGTYLLDTDTFIVPWRLEKLKYWDFDYYGLIRKQIGVTFPYTAIDREGLFTFFPECYPWASGGYGAYVSKRLAEHVVCEEPKTWAEDMFLGQVANRLYRDGKITIKDATEYEDKAAFHYPAHKFGKGYDPIDGWMRMMYEEHR